jgi:putative DNA primase/helicase
MSEFFHNERGVWFQPPSNSKGELPSPTWVCSPLEVLAITRDHDNEHHGKLLRFYDYDGIEHRWPMPLELLCSCSWLFGYGARNNRLD